EPAVPEARAGADDARPDRADDRLVAGTRSPRQRRGRPHALDLAAEARAGGERHAEQSALPQQADRVRERHRERAARDLEIGGSQTAEPRADRSDLAVEGAADDGHPTEIIGELAVLLP